MLEDAATPALVRSDQPPAGLAAPDSFADIAPVRRPRVTTSELHRAGLGLPVVARIDPGGDNAPRSGFHVFSFIVSLFVVIVSQPFATNSWAVGEVTGAAKTTSTSDRMAPSIMPLGACMFQIHSKIVFSRVTSASLQPCGSVSASHASM